MNIVMKKENIILGIASECDQISASQYAISVMEEYKSILYNFRLASGLTMKQLAVMLEISEATASRWCRKGIPISEYERVKLILSKREKDLTDILFYENI